MTPAAAAALRDEASRLRAQADRLDAIADQAAAAPEGARAEEEWLDTRHAELLVKASRTTLRLWAKKHKCGEKTGSGQWRYHRTRLLETAFNQSQLASRGANGAPDGANGAPVGIHNTPDEAHLVTDETKR